MEEKKTRVRVNQIEKFLEEMVEWSYERLEKADDESKMFEIGYWGAMRDVQRFIEAIRDGYKSLEEAEDAYTKYIETINRINGKSIGKCHIEPRMW